VIRGEIFRLRSPRSRPGAEQRGTRLAVIVHGDELLALSTVLVAPTSQSAPPRTFRPTIEVSGQTARVLVERTTAITPDRLGDSLGRLNTNELHDLDMAPALVLGL
jgi:mRNA interferase MazF